MQVFIFFGSLFFLIFGVTSVSYADCGDMTLCVRPPDPPACHTYHNVCSFVPPLVQAVPPNQAAPEAAPEQRQQAPAVPQYSITLDGLSKEQLDKIMSQLGVDTSKVQAPQ